MILRAPRVGTASPLAPLCFIGCTPTRRIFTEMDKRHAGARYSLRFARRTNQQARSTTRTTFDEVTKWVCPHRFPACHSVALAVRLCTTSGAAAW
jgi:hypothetical protein